MVLLNLNASPILESGVCVWASQNSSGKVELNFLWMLQAVGLIYVTRTGVRKPRIL